MAFSSLRDFIDRLEKYGRLVGRDGETYTFKEDTKEGVTWHCTFLPPTQRVMKAPGTAWADRIDWFKPCEEGTIWTVLWQGNARGVRVFTQWLGFQIRGKKRAFAEVLNPVVRHFEALNESED